MLQAIDALQVWDNGAFLRKHGGDGLTGVEHAATADTDNAVNTFRAATFDCGVDKNRRRFTRQADADGRDTGLIESRREARPATRTIQDRSRAAPRSARPTPRSRSAGWRPIVRM